MASVQYSFQVVTKKLFFYTYNYKRFASTENETNLIFIMKVMQTCNLSKPSLTIDFFMAYVERQFLFIDDLTFQLI